MTFKTFLAVTALVITAACVSGIKNGEPPKVEAVATPVAATPVAEAPVAEVPVEEVVEAPVAETPATDEATPTAE